MKLKHLGSINLHTIRIHPYKKCHARSKRQLARERMKSNVGANELRSTASKFDIWTSDPLDGNILSFIMTCCRNVLWNLD